MKKKPRKKNYRDLRGITIDYHWIYEHLHKNHPKYGWSPTREFEFTIMTKGLQPSHILDVGCGNGQLLKWIKKAHPDAKLYGCDIAQAALDKIEIYHVALKQCETQNLQYPDDKFDLVICTDVLEHVKPSDIQKAIKELHRIATSHVLIQTDDAACLEDKYLVDTKFDGLELHCKRTRNWWERNITSAGFQIVKYQPFGSKMTFLCTI